MSTVTEIAPDVYRVSTYMREFDLQFTAVSLLDQADEILPPIEARLHAAMVQAVGEDVADRYAEGLPSWQDTPNCLNIPEILWLRGLALAYDMHEFARTRYNLLGHGTHWFPGTNAAHLDELDLTKALACSPFKQQIPDWLRQAQGMFYQAPKKRLSES